MISFVKDSVQVLNSKLVGKFQYHLGEEIKEFDFAFPCDFPTDMVDLRLDYPFKEVSTIDKDGNEITFFPARELFICMGLHTSVTNFEFEVLYVGQAYGNDGDRNAFERLRSHPTLQNILSKNSHENPNSEIMILTFEFHRQRSMVKFDGRKKDTISGERDTKRFNKAHENNITEKEEISLIEAGLIRYFQPTFNKIYKNNFPSISHTVLLNCFNYDFSGLIVELNTQQFGFRLFSEIQKPNDLHICKFNLSQSEERHKFFQFDGDISLSPDVIDTNFD